MIMTLFACLTLTAASAQTRSDYPTVTLSNGIEMPQFGLGTFGITGSDPDSVCADAVCTALKAGYRHIDTAHSYYVERGVGQGIRESGVPREEIWLTSKLWPSDYSEGREQTLRSIDKMLERLDVDYIDLVYIHQPIGNWKEGWRGLEEAVRQGKVRCIGLSNFEMPVVSDRMQWVLDSAEIRPVIQQIECHPYRQALKERKRAAQAGMLTECWFPLGGAMSNGVLLQDPVIKKIAEAHGKTPAQVIIRWHLQEGLSVIPGSTRHDYIEENIGALDFSLTAKEMKQMRKLNKEKRFFDLPFDQLEQFVLGRPMPEFSQKEQEIIDLSNQKWKWMAEKNVDKLAELFHPQAEFVHMGGFWGTRQELRTIKEGFIWYKQADIHDQVVKFAANVATVYTTLQMTSEVGGREVSFPFFVSEVYTKIDGRWWLTTLAFTSRPHQ